MINYEMSRVGRGAKVEIKGGGKGQEGVGGHLYNTPSNVSVIIIAYMHDV